MKSEIGELRMQIERESEAAKRGLSGSARVASHAFITARMEHMTWYLQGLERAGKQEEVEMLLRSDALWEMETF